ncbi:Transcriptional regulator [Seminavis robusta]|uniref:Transcriptional regulator n=1 Tax=Seminavis robusta TaxID=568900 RepID=A0A9N8HW03_9STRA|nr:Transcriptional regulator [Seminavis robusta]|eukprot:Sro2044_g312410.1 Transcriptional regulator (1134) ;mRNA; r:13921-17322
MMMRTRKKEDPLRNSGGSGSLRHSWNTSHSPDDGSPDLNHKTCLGSRRRMSLRSSFYQPKSSSILPSNPDLEEITQLQFSFDDDDLCGRTHELAVLQHALEASSRCRNSEKHVILCGGSSGVGKTALVAAAIRRSQCIRVEGKFDFSQQHTPYSGITQACRGLCDYYLAARPSAQQIQDLREALGSSACVLAQLLPSLLALLEMPEQAMISNNNKNAMRLEEAPHRFRFAIGQFLWTIGRWENPPIICLDDLQWCDEESFKLLEMLLLQQDVYDTTTVTRSNDNNNNHHHSGGLVVVGCYRDNTDNTTDSQANSLKHWIRVLEDAAAATNGDAMTLTQLSLANLSVDAVNEMLAQVLSMEATESTTTTCMTTLEFAKVVHHKTAGNPFFVIEFLKGLSEQELLTFHLGLMKWTWNLEEIVFNTKATDNVIDLMQKKMESLPSAMFEILPLAAQLGSTFLARHLSAVVKAFQLAARPNKNNKNTQKEQQQQVSPDEWLKACVDEGFITRLENDKYCWVHDKVQEAARALVPRDRLDALQFRVGEILLQNLTPTEITENILVVANLLRKGLAYRSDIQEWKCVEIAKLLLEAGRIAMNSASFVQAAEYLQAGIHFLPPEHWTTRYELSLELYTSAAEAEYCTGGSDNMQEHCMAVVTQEDRPMSERFRAYNVLISYVWSTNDMKRAAKMALHVLSELGCKLPKRAKVLHILAGIVHMNGATKKFGPDAVLCHENMTDLQKIQAMALLDKLATITYMLRSDYLPLAILKSFQWSIKHGMSEYSPSAFSLVALIFMSKLKDFERSRTYANYAVSLAESKPEYEVALSRTLFITHHFVLHASLPYQTCMKKFVQGHTSGLATGDVENACFNALLYLDLSFLVGRNLNSLNVDWQVYTEQMRSFSQFQQRNAAVHKWQVAQCLMGQTEDPLVLKGGVFDIDDFNTEVMGASVVTSCYYALIHLAYFMCDDVNGAERVLELHRMYQEEDLNPGSSVDDAYRGHSGVLCYSAFRKTKKIKYLLRAKKCHKHIQVASRKGNPNYPHIEKLLDAEYAALVGRKSPAKKCYQDAIALAARLGLVHEQAMVNERFARYISDRGEHSESQYHMGCAINLYREWGATAKVDQLQNFAVGTATKSAIV